MITTPVSAREPAGMELGDLWEVRVVFLDCSSRSLSHPVLCSVGQWDTRKLGCRIRPETGNPAVDELRAQLTKISGVEVPVVEGKGKSGASSSRPTTVPNKLGRSRTVPKVEGLRPGTTSQSMRPIGSTNSLLRFAEEGLEVRQLPRRGGGARARARVEGEGAPIRARSRSLSLLLSRRPTPRTLPPTGATCTRSSSPCRARRRTRS